MSALADPVRSTFAEDEDFRELLELFVAHATEQAVAIPRAFEAGDFAAVRVAAHQLKGAAGGYGFPGLTEAAADLERSCQEETATRDDVEAVTSYLERLVV